MILLAVTLDELKTIADNMRPYTADAMKIEVAPWIKDYVVNMEELYTELTLEKLHNKPAWYNIQTLKHYKELFEISKHAEGLPRLSSDVLTQDSPPEKLLRIDSHSSSSDLPQDLSFYKGKRILMKGNPGMGKTTQCKKISWDWARKIFTYFHIVFFVYLKFVKPGDQIENIIIKQNPFMKGLGLTEQKLQHILLLGSRCLLVLDGLDEHALDANEDVLSIIRGEKYLNCNIIVTSRPHSTRKIERYFPMVVRVEGFTRKRAEQFASKILSDRKVIQGILDYNPGKKYKRKGYDSAKKKKGQYVPIHKCPILLSFMCLLAREDDIDLQNSELHTGEIYTRMVRCLYKKYVIRKGMSFNADQFQTTVTKIGKLALKTLLSGDPLLKRADVTREVGSDAFDFGLLIGCEEAHRLIRDETADIFVTFPHRSIQEFLGAFYLIWILDRGKEIESLLGDSCDKPIFLMNPLFLNFCLWLCNDESYFSFSNRHKVYQCLVHFSVNLINRPVCDMNIYPVLDISATDTVMDKLRVTFLTDILVKCNKKSKIILPSDDALDLILELVNSTLKAVTCIEISRSNIRFNITTFKTSNMILKTEDSCTLDHLKTILKHYTKVMKEPIVHLHLIGPVRKYSRKKLFKIPNVKCLFMGHPVTSFEKDLIPHLTHFYMEKDTCETNIKYLEQAIQTDNLLSHLSIVNCENIEGQLPVLFRTKWPHLKHLDLSIQKFQRQMQISCVRLVTVPKKHCPI